MNPLWFVLRATGTAILVVGGAALLAKKYGPKPSDLVAGAVHFKNGLDEFQKGLSTIFFGAGAPPAERPKAANKIPID